MRRAALLLALSALLLPAPAAAASRLVVSYGRTGGIAGLSDAVTVRSGGHAAVRRSRIGSRRTFTLSRARRAALARLIRRARLPRRATWFAPGLADGFRIVIRTPGHVVSYDEPSRVPPRIARLGSWLQTALERRR